MKPVPLSDFFEAIWPFMNHRTGVAETVRALGPSSSGVARLALYPELIRRQKQSILDHFFSSVRAAFGSSDAGRWERLTAEYMRKASPHHWEPNHYAQPMVAFLEAEQASDASIPYAAVELADFAWIRFEAMMSAHPPYPDPGLGSAVFVRQYAHEISTFAFAAETRTLAPGALPSPVPCTVLVYRSRSTQRLEILRPSVATLIALRRREAPGAPFTLPSALVESDVDHEETDLIQRGVLAARPTAA